MTRNFTTPCCTNCKGEHKNDDQNYPFRIKEKQIVELKAAHRFTYFEAKEKLKGNNFSGSRPCSYSGAVRQEETQAVFINSAEITYIVKPMIEAAMASLST